MNTQHATSGMLRPYRNLLYMEKMGIGAILILSFFFLPKFAFEPTSFLDFKNTSLPTGKGLWERLLFPISHANIFHLAANTLCVWLMKIRLRLPLTVAISFVCSLLPQWSLWGAEPILGFSGVIFAAVGIVYGKLGQFKRMAKTCLLPVIICGLFPHVALTFHIYTLLIGYAIGSCMLRYHCNPKNASA